MDKINNVINQYVNKARDDFKFSIKQENILPFNTRANRLTYATGFNGIVGEIARRITNYNMVDINIENRLDEMIEEGTIDVNCENHDDLIMMIDEFNPTKANISHSNYNLFKFYPLSASKSVLGIDKLTAKHEEQNTREKTIAKFILDIVLNNDSKLKAILLSEEENSDIFTKLYHEIYKSDIATKTLKTSFIKYHGLYDEVISEDLSFMIEHHRFFSKNCLVVS
jgi:hypothetical protein